MSRNDRSTFDAAALLDLAERVWAPMVCGGGWPAWDANAEMTGATAVALGSVYRGAAARERREMVRRWPACLVVCLTAVAAAHAGRGRFWPHWWAACRVRGSARDATAWGEMFLAALRTLGLPERSGPDRRRYVEAIMAYAGVVDEAGPLAVEPECRVTLDAFGQGIAVRDVPEGEPRPAMPSEVVDSGDPLLVFSEDGDLIPAEAPLPAEAVWTIFPADREPIIEGQVRVVAEGSLPSAWRGWRLVQFALEPAARLGLDGGPWRAARGRRRARICEAVPVPGVTTPDGTAVLDAPPAVWLPGGGEDGWRIEVRPAGGGPAVFDGRVDAPVDTEVTTLWRRVPRPVLGVFTVAVHGPPDRGTRQVIAVAEGLRVTCDPAVRTLAPEGLAPAVASATSPSGLRVSPSAPAFAPTVRSARVTCRTVCAELAFVLTPPHMLVIAEPAPGGWSGSPLRLAMAALNRTVALRVAVPGRPAPRILEVVAGGRAVQEVAASGRPAGAPGVAGSGTSAGVARFSLKRVLDTVTSSGGADLLVRVDGRPVPVAYVRPGGLADGVTRRGDRLVLSGAAGVAGLVAWVGSDEQGEMSGPIEVGADYTITLPPALVGATRLWVRLVVRDPWLPEDPGSGETFLVP